MNLKNPLRRVFCACEKIIGNSIDGQKWPFYIKSHEQRHGVVVDGERKMSEITKYSLDKLCSMKAADLSKLSKVELVESIAYCGFQYRQAIDEQKKLQKQIEENQSNERAACVMISGFLGDEITKDDYRGTIDSRKMNILELTGRAIAVSIKNKNN